MKKRLTLACAAVFAFFLASPPHECDVLETDADHADHCPVCLSATAPSAVLEDSSAFLPDYGLVGHVAGTPEPGYPRIRNTQHQNRAPPLP